MILVEIEELIKFKSIKWISEGLSGLKAGQTYERFPGDHPANPEYGSVVLSVKVLQGKFKEITQLLVIGDNAEQGRLVDLKMINTGNYRVEVEFDTIFGHGLEYSTAAFLQKGVSIIGFTETERNSLETLDGQKELLSLLSLHILPARSRDILEFAKPGFLCVPNEISEEADSYFMGRPAHNRDEISDYDEEPLMHLATMKSKDFPEAGFPGNIADGLSFYLKVRAEDGWPDRRDDFRILKYSGSGPKKATLSQSFEPPSNFNIKPLLDIPEWNHSLLHVLNFSEDEIDAYQALRAVYLQLAMGDLFEREINKLFGFPDSLQHCLAYEAERMFHKRGHDDEVYKGAANWVLLLQVSPDCKWFSFFDQIGDYKIYFMLKQKDLEINNFENCQVIVQH